MKTQIIKQQIHLLSLAILFVLTLAATQPVQAQTYKVLHTFSAGSDGAHPLGLTIDGAGRLYGTAAGGGFTGGSCGDYGCGTVFQLARKGSDWVLNPLHSFIGSDGADPRVRVVFGPDGSLYGTTAAGGSNYLGVAFKLSPRPIACKSALCPWTATVLYSFTGGTEGSNPAYGPIVFDSKGNIYGATTGGGSNGWGAIYELVKSSGGWTPNPLYGFTGDSDGGEPTGVVFDDIGQLYGSTRRGGDPNCDCGTVFQLIPSGSGWTKILLHSFKDGTDGAYPMGGLIFDGLNKLFGTTNSDGPNGGGTAFTLTRSGGSWTFAPIFGFAGLSGTETGSEADLVMDKYGNLYGTTYAGGDGGTVFELSPMDDGSWQYTLLHEFGYSGEGRHPAGNLVVDADGNLYGTTIFGGDPNCGGDQGCGVLWQITP